MSPHRILKRVLSALLSTSGGHQEREIHTLPLFFILLNLGFDVTSGGFNQISSPELTTEVYKWPNMGLRYRRRWNSLFRVAALGPFRMRWESVRILDLPQFHPWFVSTIVVLVDFTIVVRNVDYRHRSLSDAPWCNGSTHSTQNTVIWTYKRFKMDFIVLLSFFLYIYVHFTTTLQMHCTAWQQAYTKYRS